MYQISELAESVGLSRATLLYYEKLGLLRGKRQANGYRIYSDADRQRLRLMQQMQAGGLSLQECQLCLDGKFDREMLGQRLAALEQEIAAKTRSRDLLTALLGRGSLKDWHEEVERVAPDLHRVWLMTQGFSSEEAARVVWLSKDMNEHNDYMAGFMEVFSGLTCWGPATEVATLKALAMAPSASKTILEVGCGPGMATMTLAEATDARILATDTDEGALNRLRDKVAALGLGDRVEVRHVDMAHLPAPQQPWDVIWAEGSAYIIGIERALHDWRQLLRPGGVLVFSEMVWRTEKPSDELRAYWASEYPAMTRVPVRLEQATRAGYRVLGHFDMGREAMDSYYQPLEARVVEMDTRAPRPHRAGAPRLGPGLRAADRGRCADRDALGPRGRRSSALVRGSGDMRNSVFDRSLIWLLPLMPRIDRRSVAGCHAQSTDKFLRPKAPRLM